MCLNYYVIVNILRLCLFLWNMKSLNWWISIWLRDWGWFDVIWSLLIIALKHDFWKYLLLFFLFFYKGFFNLSFANFCKANILYYLVLRWNISDYYIYYEYGISNNTFLSRKIYNIIFHQCSQVFLVEP